MTDQLPEGAWTLGEARKKMEEKKKQEEEKRRGKRKVTKKNNANNLNTSEPDESPSLPRKKKNKTRMPPMKPTKRGIVKPVVDSNNDNGFDIPPAKNQTTPIRSSQRIRNRIVYISSDSDSDLELLSINDKEKILTNGNGGRNHVNNANVKSSLKSPKNTSKHAPKKPEPTSPKAVPNKRGPSKKVEHSPVKKPKVIISKPKKNNKNFQEAGKRKGKSGPVKAGDFPPLDIGTKISNPYTKCSFELKDVLGKGGFGYIYVISDPKIKGDAVCKIEPRNNGPLFTEMHFYMRLGKKNMIEAFRKKEKLKYLGIPVSHGFGVQEVNGESYRYLLIPKFETDLLKIYEEQNNRFSLETTLLITIRMLEALKYIHESEYVHADIKSGNILAKNNNKEVYLADFGLASLYSVDGEHKAYCEDPKQAHNGTKEYTSIDAHKGVLPSRRGDLQILGYCAVEWLGAKLPWKDVENPNTVRDQKISHERDTLKFIEGCFKRSNLKAKPWKAVKKFIAAIHNLGYEECPDYTDLIAILRSGLESEDNGYITWK